MATDRPTVYPLAGADVFICLYAREVRFAGQRSGPLDFRLDGTAPVRLVLTRPPEAPSLTHSLLVHSTFAPTERRFSTKRGCARRIGSAFMISERPSMLAATISNAIATRMM
ncbi:hypothetical protein BX589_109178 [Paraburkholderia fungorum]|nr:hypothetical protein BX589_109178 [Paraburkholderia fungorum]